MVEHDWRHQGCRKDGRGGKRTAGGTEKSVSDGSYGNWRFITQRQAYEVLLTVLATRGDTTSSRRELSSDHFADENVLMKIKQRKRRKSTVSIFPFLRLSPFRSPMSGRRDMTGRFYGFLFLPFPRHRNYFVITRSLCKREKGSGPGLSNYA